MIKVIDLLNKIAKGEDVPEKIKYDNEIYEYRCDLMDYKNDIYLFEMLFSSGGDFLNDEVEVIEDNYKIEKIKITDDKYILNTITNSYNQPTSWGYFLANKINEIIDKLEELDNERSNK